LCFVGVGGPELDILAAGRVVRDKFIRLVVLAINSNPFIILDTLLLSLFFNDGDVSLILIGEFGVCPNLSAAPSLIFFLARVRGYFEAGEMKERSRIFDFRDAQHYPAACIALSTSHEDLKAL
jgi:hypothetical protein